MTDTISIIALSTTAGAFIGAVAWASVQRIRHASKFDGAVKGVMDLVAQMDANLGKRKATRLIESERVKAGKLAAQRERWQRDPMRRSA